MATINPQTLQLYYDTRNYAAAAEYLRTAKAKDYRSQQKLNAHIRQLERDAAIQQANIVNLKPEEKEAYDFIQSMNGNGTIPRNREITINGVKQKVNNKYGTNYLNYINDLKSKDGNSINRIAIDVENDDDLTLISDALGLKNINSNELGIAHQILGKGKHRLIVNRDNKNLYKILNATNDALDFDWEDMAALIAKRATVAGIAGAGIGGLAGAGVGAGPGGMLGAGFGTIWGAVEAPIYATQKRYSISGIDAKGNVYDADNFNYNNLEFALDEVNKANDIYKSIEDKTIQSQTFTTESVVTQFLGAGHAEAYKALQQGKIDYTTFDKITKEWEATYDRLISGADFTKHKVFAWSADSGEGVNLKEVGNDNVPDLKGEVLLAMKEGRVSKALCVADGEIGTLLTISPKTAKDGDWSEAKGEVQKQIFIQGLFEGTAEQAFEADTKTKAARQNADMKKWNYEQKLVNGTTVGYNGGIPYVKVLDGAGGMVAVSIPEEDMLMHLNENSIVENSVLEVLANLDENGELPYQTINGQRVKPTVEEMLKAFSIAATNEMHPKGSTTERERVQYQNDIFTAMSELYKRYYDYQNN